MSTSRFQITVDHVQYNSFLTSNLENHCLFEEIEVIGIKEERLKI